MNVNCDKLPCGVFRGLQSIFVGLSGMAKAIYIACMVLLMAVQGIAQRDHFVYLQTDNQEPFYIVFGGVNYSSSSAGHLILPKLADAEYKVDIGFPGKIATTTFVIPISGKDEGYLIATDAEKPSLRHVLSGATMQAYQPPAPKPVVVVKEEAKPEVTAIEKKVEPTVTAAVVVAADSVASAPVAVTVKSEAAPPAETDKPVTMDTKTMTLEEKLKALEAEEARMMASYKKGEPVKNSAGKEANKQEKKTSAANAIPEGKTGETIYVEGAAAATVAKKTESEATPKTETKSAVVNTVPPVQSTATKSAPGVGDRKFLDMELGVDSAQLVKPIAETNNVPTQKANTVIAAVNSAVSDTMQMHASTPKAAETLVAAEVQEKKADTVNTIKPVAAARKPCTQIMSDSAFSKLQTTLDAITDEDDLIYEARKSFKQQCVTTYQIKTIAAAAKTDALRYRMLDAAWPYAADYFNYRELRSLLKDDYYITRFDAMIQ